MQKEPQPNQTLSPGSPEGFHINLGSDKQFNDDQYPTSMKLSNASNQNNQLLNTQQNETGERKNSNNKSFDKSQNGQKVQGKPIIYDQNSNQDFLKEAPKIRATKIEAIGQKNGDSGEDIYMGTQSKERSRDKHFTFFQKRLLHTIVSESDNDVSMQKRKFTGNTNKTNSNDKDHTFINNTYKYDSFNKHQSGQNHSAVTKDNVGNSKFQSNIVKSGNPNSSNTNNQNQINQSMKKSEFNKSDPNKKNLTIKESSEKLWAIKMWYMCIIASIIGVILSLVGFYISNSSDNKDILCFIIYPINAIFLQVSLIAIQRLIFIKIKVIEQEKAQAQSFNREKVNKKRFYSWIYFYTVYSNVSARLIIFSVLTVVIYAPIIEMIVLPKLEPSGGLQKLDDIGNYQNSLSSRRNFLLIQVVLRFIWVYIICYFNYFLLNQEYSRVEHLAKSEQNQNADRNQYLGQIYKEFENDLIQLENRMHIGLTQQNAKTHTMAEFLKASFHENAVTQNNGGTMQNIMHQNSNSQNLHHQNSNNLNIIVLNNLNQMNPNKSGHVLNIPPQAIISAQGLAKKQSLAQITMDPKKSNILDVGVLNHLQSNVKPTSINQFEYNTEIAGVGTFLQIGTTLSAKQLQKQKTIEKRKQLRVERLRDLLQFWVKISREDIFALSQNIFLGLSIFLVSIVLTLNVMTNYLVDESEIGYYITFILYFFFISLMFFKGIYEIRRRQLEISKKVIRPTYFILASVGATTIHFELARNIRQAYVLSIIKFIMTVIFLHVIPWVKQSLIQRDIAKQMENVFRQSVLQRGPMRKSKNSVDFRPSRIVDIREVTHVNDEKKIFQYHKLTLIQFLVAFCITDISSSVSFIASTFVCHIDNQTELISVLHSQSDYYQIYIILLAEIVCYLLLVVFTIFFYKRQIAKSEFEQLKNYSFVLYTRDLVKSNLTAILLLYFYAWHSVFLLLNN